MELLTTQDVADWLKIKKHTLEVQRSEGNPAIPYIKIGRLVRYDKQDVLEYLRANKTKVTYPSGETHHGQ